MVLAGSATSTTLLALSLPEGVRYYIVRNNDTLVPLVPADQLPFQIHGVPRQLQHQQLLQEKWQWVGNTSESKSLLQVQAPAQHSPMLQPSNPPKFLAPDHNVRADEGTVQIKNRIQPTLNPASPSSKATESPRREGLPTTEYHGKSLTDTIANIYQKDAQRLNYTPRNLFPSGTPPDPTKKEYCTHWVRTGECDYIVQGCRYKHEMPPIEKLREIGFSTVPRWWKEKSVLKGPTWMQRRMQGGKEDSKEPVALSPKSSAVHGLFKQLKRQTSSVDGDLIDLCTPAPPPSRRSSNSSSTTRSVAESDASSDVVSLPSLADSEPPSTASLPQTPTRDSSPISSSQKAPVDPQPLIRKDKALALRRHTEISLSSDDGEVRTLPPKRLTAPKVAETTPSVAPAKPGKKGGLLRSKYAVKAKPSPTGHSKSTQARGKKNTSAAPGLEKQITKLTRERHEKKATRAVPDQKKAAVAALI